MFDFYYQQGNSRRKLFQVAGSHCSIGSARSNDLVIDSRQMSKRQAELRLEASGVYLRDLGSLSGCWVNRERIVDYGPLSELDEVEVGSVSVSIKAVRLPTGQSAQGHSAQYNVSGSDRSSSNGATGLMPQRGTGLGQVSVAQIAQGQSSDDLRGQSSANPVSSRHLIHDPVSQDRTSHRSTSDQILLSSRSDQTSPSPTSDQTSPGSTSQRQNSHSQESPCQAPQPQTSEDLTEVTTGAVFDEALSYWGRIVHEQLLFQMDLQRKDVNRMSDEQLRTESSQLIDKIISTLQTQLPETLDRSTLARNVLNESVGLGPLEEFLDDESITEIMVNNHKEIFIERAGKLERSSMTFSSDATVFAVIERIITPIGRRIDESSPIVDARLKDGSRVNAVIPPLALKGPSLTIRKFPKRRMQFSDLVASGSVIQPMVDFLRVCVEMRKNIIVSGGTGSGKTTLLNVLSNFIPATDRIVTIEDAAELKLIQPNLVSLESRPPNLEGKGEVPIRDLVKNALRMRPDRIVVGECRGGEAIDMLQAMNTGHDGSLTTIHANNPRDVLSRLEVLVLMAGIELPVTAIREQVSSAVDIIIQQTRFPCGSRKITRITEVVGIESGTVQLQDIFRYEPNGVDEHQRINGEFVPTGAIPTFYEELRGIGIDVELDCFRGASAEARR